MLSDNLLVQINVFQLYSSTFCMPKSHDSKDI